MALSNEGMTDDIIEAMQAAGFEPLADKCASRKWWLALSKGIVKHINENADVKVTGGSSQGTYKVE